MKKSTATEAIRVASEIAAIRAALKERGYHIQKQPKQAAWKVTLLSPPLPTEETAGALVRSCYLLTYQPAPISAWVLHFQNNYPDCLIIETIIQSATKKQLANTTRRSGR
jgi:hypothetical protein